MKSFYSVVSSAHPGIDGATSNVESLDSLSSSYIRSRARIAVYDSPAAAPRVEEVVPAPVPEYVEALTDRVYELSHAAGGSVPYTVVREVTENFIHADFAEPIVSILDGGGTIRFADQGPGIADKDRALRPGFTTAGEDAKRFIRGVGSGLPIVQEYLVHSGGSLVIEDNLGSGSVVTIKSAKAVEASVKPPARPLDQDDVVAAPGARAIAMGVPRLETVVPHVRLGTRQKQVLALVLESGSAGPSLVAKELGVGISTAYRDLASLEDLGLISSDGGKRALTPAGLSYLDDLSAR